MRLSDFDTKISVLKLSELSSKNVASLFGDSAYCYWWPLRPQEKNTTKTILK